MRYYPIFLDTAAARILVSGADEAATAKLRLLLKTEGQISVFGDNPTEEVLRWAEEGRLRHYIRPIEESDLNGAAMLYVAHADGAERLVTLAHKHGVLVNVVDTPALCDFITPAMVDRDPVVVAIGTEGTAPMLARQIKSSIEGLLHPSTGVLAQLAAKSRHKVEAVAAGSPRRALWARFFGGEGSRALEQGGEAAVDRVIEDLVDEAGNDASQGHVALVGAGPGDPELLTRKAQRLLGDADVVIHDRLVSGEILELARREARLVDVGKKAYGKSWKQPDIDALIVAEARSGHKVVRLKSGDPGIYGRLDEEVAALRAASVPFEVVPGITAAMAGAAERAQFEPAISDGSRCRWLCRTRLGCACLSRRDGCDLYGCACRALHPGPAADARRCPIDAGDGGRERLAPGARRGGDHAGRPARRHGRWRHRRTGDPLSRHRTADRRGSRA